MNEKSAVSIITPPPAAFSTGRPGRPGWFRLLALLVVVQTNAPAGLTNDADARLGAVRDAAQRNRGDLGFGRADEQKQKAVPAPVMLEKRGSVLALELARVPLLRAIEPWKPVFLQRAPPLDVCLRQPGTHLHRRERRGRGGG